MKEFPPSVSPFDFVTSADVVGLILATSDYTDDELTAISQWMFQVAQYISTYIAQKQVLQDRKKDSSQDESSNYLDEYKSR